MTDTSALVPENPSSVAAEPQLEVSKNLLSLIITRPEDTAECAFWIGVYRHGRLGPRDIFNVARIEKIFQLLSEEGLDENEPLMLSDSSGELARQFYLVPENLCKTRAEEALALILKTLESLKPQRIGLYFESSEEHEASEPDFLTELLRGLAHSDVQEIFLFTGKLGVNSVLNSALRVKKELSGQKELQVWH